MSHIPGAIILPVHHDKVYSLYVVRVCVIRNNVEHLCNSNLLLYSIYIYVQVEICYNVAHLSLM